MEVSLRVERDDPAYAGQAGYNALGLKIYDSMVYKFTGPVLWRCTEQQWVAFYDDNVSAHHLDIGVATGALLDKCSFPVPDPDITLMDLNPRSLAFAAHRLQRYTPRTHQANILDPWSLSSRQFESVAMMNILHCVPGNIGEKAVAFDHAEAALVPGGTLFGSTILGRGVEHTRKSSLTMRWLNRKGVFCNSDDSLEDLDAALASRFPAYQIDVQGVVALFVAKAGV